MASVLTRTPQRAASMRPSCEQPEVAALADDLAPQLLAVDPDGVVGAVADRRALVLGGRLDVGADAAVPEQVDRGQQDRVDQLGRGHRRRRPWQAERLGHLGRDRDRLQRTRSKTPPPAEISERVVVGPRRARAGRTAAAARRRRSPASGVGSTKTCRWSKAATSRMCSESSMPLPKTSPLMSPTPTTVKSCGLGVDAHLAEVPLDRLPGAAGGDAHRLVVVAGRAARGERVVEPEAVATAPRRWRCRRTWPCPCRPRRRGRRRRRRAARRARAAPPAPGDPVVGEVEQPGDEHPVGRVALGQPRLAVDRRVGQLLGVEAALGAGRHDDGVLDHLRLDQAEDLGAEVLAPVGPAQPAAGDRAEAQVHALDARAVDPDLELRPRGRQVGHLLGVELEARRRPWASPSASGW